MTDQRVQKLAQTLVNYSVEIKPGDLVVVRGDVSALPLIREIYKQTLVTGGKCFPYLVADPLVHILYRYGNHHKLDFFPICEPCSMKDPHDLFRGLWSC